MWVAYASYVGKISVTLNNIELQLLTFDTIKTALHNVYQWYVTRWYGVGKKEQGNGK